MKLPAIDTLRSVLRFKPIETDVVIRRLNRAASVADLRRIARRRLPRGVFDYIDGAAEDEHTLAANSAAFTRTTFRPRILRDVGAVEPGTTLLGKPLALPLVLAPTGFSRIADPQGELAVARAAERAGLPYTLSTLATRSIEEVRGVSAGRLWFQVYVWRDRGLVKEMIARAEAAQYEALVLTVDTAVLGRRERDVRRGFSLPPKVGLGTLLDGAIHPGWTWAFVRSEPIRFANVAGQDVGDGSSAVSLADYINTQFDPGLAWGDVDWLRSVWDGPLVVVLVEDRHDGGPGERGVQHRLADGGGHVGDPHLDGRELRGRADIPIDHAVVQHHADVLHPLHRIVVVARRVEVRWRPGAGPARPQHPTPTGIAAVGVAVDRRIRGQGQQQRQPGPQPVAHPDRGFPVRHRHVHMTAADPLLVRDHAESVRDAAVTVRIGDREMLRQRRWQSDGQQQAPGGLGGLARDPPQSVQLRPQVGDGSGDLGGRLDLTAGQFQLQIHAVGLRTFGDPGVQGDRFTRVWVDEKEFLLHTEGGMAGHDLPERLTLRWPRGPCALGGLPVFRRRQTGEPRFSSAPPLRRRGYDRRYEVEGHAEQPHQHQHHW